MAGLRMTEIKAIQGAEVVSDSSGRQYHINCAPGEIAEYIILVGSPERVDMAAKLLTDIKVKQRHREFNTITGKYKDVPITVMSTGIGPDNIEIAMVELLQVTQNPSFIRVGTCGTLQPNMPLGDFVISTGAVRLENTSLYFVPEGYPSVANYELNLALMAVCDKYNKPFHMGLTAAASGFYGSQGREIPGIPLRYPNLPEDLAKINVVNMEMESSALFTLANLKNLRASMICLNIINRVENKFIDFEQKAQGELDGLQMAMEAYCLIDVIDREKTTKQQKYWIPNFGRK